ncbi:MAG: S1 family peptidase [Bacteriovoracaceae bacterium]
MKSTAFWLSLCLSMSSWGHVQGINPSKVNQAPFYLYKNVTVDQSTNKVKVEGFSYSQSGSQIYIDPEGSKLTTDLDKFIFYRRLGSSSFEATTGSGTASGTAFLVGKDLVLTNMHVASTDNAKKACGHFSVTLETVPRQEVNCKKVWYCDTHDFCLIELNKTKENLSVGDFTKPLSLTTKLIRTGSNIYLIGNSFGLGVQGSEGKGYKYIDRIKQYGEKLAMQYFSDSLYDLDFYAPSLGGASGSPIFDDTGAVVGINYAHQSPSGSPIASDVRNLAVPAYYMVSQLKKFLTADIFNKISVDKNNLENKVEYERQWNRAYKESTNEYFFKFEDLMACVDSNIFTTCDQLVNQEFNPQMLKTKYPMLSQIEINVFDWPAKKMKQIFYELSSFTRNSTIDYFENEKFKNLCVSEKKLTEDCIKAKQVRVALGKLPYFSRQMKDYDVNQIEQLVTSLAKRVSGANSDFYMSLSDLLKRDKKLIAKLYVGCLSATDKMFILDRLFDGFETPVYLNKCNDQAFNSLKNDGWAIDENQKKDIALALRSSPLINDINTTFRENVLKSWKIFLNQPTQSKVKRHNFNLKLITAWAQDQNLDLDAKKVYDSISKKMRYFYF